MTVGRICSREVDLAKADETVESAAKRMRKRWVGSLVVLSPENEPIGIITDRDLATRILAEGLEPTETRVRDVMTAAPETLTEDATIESALSVMRSGGFRRAPVVDEDGELVGLVTLDDILALLAEEFRAIRDLIARQKTPPT